MQLFQLIGLVPLGFLLLETPNTEIALYGLLITSVVTLVTTWMNNRAAQAQRSDDLKKLDAERTWDREDREEHRKKLDESLAENTAITQLASDNAEVAASHAEAAIVEAKTAFNEANNTNAKIAKLHQQILDLQNSQNLQLSAELATNTEATAANTELLKQRH